AAQHNVGRLEKLQSFEKIYAPFDGVLTARNTDVGALIDAGSGGTAHELFHLADDTRMRVYVNVPQEYARQIHDGLQADLVLNELPGKRFHGVVVRSAGAVDPVERTLLVEVDVENTEGRLLSGEYAQIHFALRDAQPAVLLPGNTLLFRPQGVRVAVVGDDNKIKLMPVVLGTDYGTRVAIASGLTGHERVVLNPPDSIIDGQAVRIAPPRANNAAPASTGSAE
ncbi:MAG: efflux RND transporter periplasmic adaptor subunit, partial [Janthinobacterium lividum]